MKRTAVFWVLALSFVLFATGVPGAKHGGALLLAFEVPVLSGRVVDSAAVLNEEGVKRIENAILRLEQATEGGQMAVVTLKPLEEGMSIEEAGIAIAEKWKIGRKGKDDGAILILIPESRKMRLEIAYGWEGPIPDAKAGDILREMKGFLREERYADAAVFAVCKVQEFVTGKAPEGEDVPVAPKGDEASELDFETLCGVGLLLGGIVFFFWILNKFFGWIGGFFGGGGGGSSSDSDSSDSSSSSSDSDYSGGGGDYGGGGSSDDW